MTSWAELEQAANKISHETGFPVATILGQAYAETSGNPQHAPGNNWFGIKGKGGSQSTQEVVNGKRVTINANFQGFKNAEESIRRYLEVVQKLVPNWRQLSSRPADLVAAIKDAGYATENRDTYLRNATQNPIFRKYAGQVPEVKDSKQMSEEQYYKAVKKVAPNVWGPDIINSYRKDVKPKKTSFLDSLIPQAYAEEPSIQQQQPLNQYQVKQGDTLWGIAQQYLGNGNRWQELQGYGGSPQQLPVGQRLNIPRPQPVQQPQPAQRSTTPIDFRPSPVKAASPSLAPYTPPKQTILPTKTIPTSQVPKKAPLSNINTKFTTGGANGYF